MQPVNHFSLNISNQGVVPKEPQIFCLLLPCGTLMPSKLEVSMKINFTSLNNVTVLNVVMKKDCSSGKDYLIAKRYLLVLDEELFLFQKTTDILNNKMFFQK